MKSLNLKPLNLNYNIMKVPTQRYEAPQTEIIEIESQGVLCASGGGASAAMNFNGNGGVHFGTDNGNW